MVESMRAILNLFLTDFPRTADQRVYHLGIKSGEVANRIVSFTFAGVVYVKFVFRETYHKSLVPGDCGFPVEGRPHCILLGRFS